MWCGIHQEFPLLNHNLHFQRSKRFRRIVCQWARLVHLPHIRPAANFLRAISFDCMMLLHPSCWTSYVSLPVSVLLIQEFDEQHLTNANKLNCWIKKYYSKANQLITDWCFISIIIVDVPFFCLIFFHFRYVIRIYFIGIFP